MRELWSGFLLKEMQEMEAPEEETQFDNYLTVQDVVTELHGVHVRVSVLL